MILLDQFIMMAIAVAAASQEEAFTWPWRYGAIFPDSVSKSRKAHQSGAVMVILIALGLAWTTGFWITLGCLLMNLLAYWLVFDIAYALQIGKPWYYLGSTADLDEALSHLGRYPGKVKACIVGGILLLFNALLLV